MQTFLPYRDPVKCAQVLDNKRLGKQRVETIQIMHALLGEKKGWVNHPAVKMWKGYEPFLVRKYLHSMLTEWNQRGYNSPKCIQHMRRFLKLSICKGEIIKPWWFDHLLLFKSHQSNLIRKDPEFYKSKFPGVSDDMEYIWPV